MPIMNFSGSQDDEAPTIWNSDRALEGLKSATRSLTLRHYTKDNIGNIVNSVITIYGVGRVLDLLW